MINFNNLEYYYSDKIISASQAVDLATTYKKNYLTVGLCNGAFDILHPGHIKHLESAKLLCDILFVSLTPDKFIAKRKDDSRPVYPWQIRAYSLTSLKFVDYVFSLDEELSYKSIELIQPTYFIKGPDYKNLNSSDIEKDRTTLKKFGGEIRYTSDPKFSTTELIEYIKLL